MILSRFIYVFYHLPLMLINALQDGWSSSIKRESMAIFDFKLIPPCLQSWLPLILQTSKMNYEITVPPGLDRNRWLFLILFFIFYVFNNSKKKVITQLMKKFILNLIFLNNITEKAFIYSLFNKVLNWYISFTLNRYLTL